MIQINEETFNNITRAITDNATNALFLMDTNGVCTFLNPAAEKIFGYKLDELQGNPLHDFIHCKHPDGSRFPIDDCPIGKSVFTLQNLKEHEDLFITKNAVFVPVKCSAKPIINGGQLTGVLLEVRDISHEKRAEEALRESEHRYRDIAKNLEILVQQRTKQLEESNNDLRQFAHVASHDLKEPVRKIQLFVNRLASSLSTRVTKDERAYLTKIQNSADRLWMMIEGVLGYSMMNGNAEQKQLVDLNKIMQDIEDDLEVSLERAKAALHYPVLPTIDGAPFLIYQLFYNLIYNSIKFARTDVAPEIKIDATINDHHIDFTITDNGIGFEQKFAETIFEPFTRLNNRSRFDGTGLGLSLCKKIVERHNGKIAARGELDKGATFLVTLPILQSSQQI